MLVPLCLICAKDQGTERVTGETVRTLCASFLVRLCALFTGVGEPKRRRYPTSEEGTDAQAIAIYAHLVRNAAAL